MNLSRLQKYILKKAWESKNPRVSRDIFDSFYNFIKDPPSQKIRANIITKSMERLISRGLIAGFGEKTQHKLFIQYIRLTPLGRKTARQLLGTQSEFPFIKKLRQ
ncbi:hypothetical protein HON36_05520 [Candidatus Parcubacteria bacterium]|jgi:hypothetical protein|nr:hypothetical protein [Candidatus Parcubacteria bacterium]MBT7227941.1 hypothetical protein [Candidatus Parcubacteria bacterium]